MEMKMELELKSIKKELRAWVRARKKEHSEEECSFFSSRIGELLEAEEHFQKASSILLYYALKDEVQTQALIDRWADRKEIWLPVVKGEELEIRRYTGRESLHIGAYGIEEPNGPLLTDLHRIELAVIPGMSFDRQGHRLGRGKGYYDRLLPQLRAYTLGICYRFQVAEEVPCEPFDRAMQAVLTEEGWLYRSED
jgi:5-formyltetrahydrofolate cyclo-ligase